MTFPPSICTAALTSGVLAPGMRLTAAVTAPVAAMRTETTALNLTFVSCANGAFVAPPRLMPKM